MVSPLSERDAQGRHESNVVISTSIRSFSCIYISQHVLERHLGCIQAQMGEGEEISEGNAGWIWGSFGILARIHSYDESQIQGFRFMMNLDPL